MITWAVSLLAIIATFAPAVRSLAEHRRRELACEVAVPELIDLLRLASGSGASVHQVLGRIAEHEPPEFSEALGRVRHRVARGDRLGDALDLLVESGGAVRPVGVALRSAAFDGIPLGPALDRVAIDARLRRRRNAEIAARRLPVKLLFPLIVCILPAFGLLTVVPLLLAAIGDIQL